MSASPQWHGGPLALAQPDAPNGGPGASASLSSSYPGVFSEQTRIFCILHSNTQAMFLHSQH